MKKILLNEVLPFYRTNLHCHSTISDGKKTPEELKAYYKAHGYSAVAFTDHEAFIPHNDLTDDSFVALNAYELDASDPSGSHKTCHICLVALEPDNDLDIFYHRTDYFWGNCEGWRDRVHFDPDAPDYERVYSHEGINDIFSKARAAGFFVTYNHPTWSLESYPEYSGYKGMNAMEIYTHGSLTEGYDDDNGHAYDDILRGGERIFCVATDDNHNWQPDGSPRCDSFGGYVMINAPELSYKALTGGLEGGNFYSSTGTCTHVGPEIHSLIWEDGKVTIKTSPARTIALIPCTRSNQLAAAADGETITEAAFTLRPDETWFRLVVTDREGYKAYTNAYFCDEMK